MKHSRRYRELKSKIEPKKYSVDEAIEKVKELASAKYDESLDVSIQFNINPKKTDQQIRGISNLPHGTGKKKKILVLTKGEKEQEAKKAGADYVGFEEYIEKIKKGWADVDIIIATPDTMSDVGKLGKILGPKGLMPSPKVGTVTFEVGAQVEALKKGKVEFKTDKTGCLHISVGRVSFETKKLRENLFTFFEDLLAAKPQSIKGQFLKSVTLSSTIGPGIKLDEKAILNELHKGGS
ncbi:50S ribosomal protein L1 [candidate division WOR-3 bacterium]|jgi:large subunit ribosomal protein L1|nr:50S ribosomal protein L1 [candidate division WOR-3 bacterium]NOR16949.1 50S ribosomal protein L1 [candidate division WOR-3 bacterium]